MDMKKGLDSMDTLALLTDIAELRRTSKELKGRFLGRGQEIVRLTEKLNQAKCEHQEMQSALTDLDEDFSMLQKQRDDLEEEHSTKRIDLACLQELYDALKQRYEGLIERFPQSAEGATIFPDTPVFKMVQNPDGMWDVEEHFVRMGAESLRVTETPLSECYVFSQMGIDAMEGR